MLRVLNKSASFRALSNGVPLRAAMRCMSSDPFALTDKFVTRHIGPNEADVADMLKTVGFSSLDDFLTSTVPRDIRLASPMELSHPGTTEQDALKQLADIASKNTVNRSFIGMGYHDTITPPVIQRNMLENPGWYTAYTPYQAEIAQGRLEMLLNFQTMVASLTGMELCNASLLDEGTAAAEAMAMAVSASKKRDRYFVSNRCHPQTIGVVQTRADALGIQLVVGDESEAEFANGDGGYCGVLLQYPDTYGVVTGYEDVVARAKAAGTLVAMATDVMSLSLLTPPGELGADVVVGSSQRFGVPMGFGGPHAGFLATHDKFSRKLPGRIIGVSRDSAGNPALRMAMQTREQHIRRDKATSNICTAQALLANAAAAYGMYHGPLGVKDIAQRIRRITGGIAASLSAAGYPAPPSTPDAPYFDTFAVDVSGNGRTATQVAASAAALGVNVRIVDQSTVGISVGEGVERADVVALLSAFGATMEAFDAACAAGSGAVEGRYARTSEFMEHPVFNSYHSETQMLRYLASLERKDVALNQSMISLGSCTMKLNSTSEMMPILWPEFASMHPFAPADQTQGYLEMIGQLNEDLAVITGFHAVSTQPNSGAQGEFAGLLTIAAYLRSIDQGHRNICLIPTSAHGTNPASAAMAGMKVVVVKNLPNGNIDRSDLEAKVEKHKDNLAALMVTYPSTYGVFEEGIREMIQLVHGAGGQVYMDGANMNAQVGLCSPGDIGADVCHLNLHKTFCIPHGGGGPGVGSIGVARHLAPFLPGNAVLPCGGEGGDTVPKTGGAVSAAPFGSAMILPIPWMYLRCLGGSGLTRATSIAMLNANYMAKRLSAAYDVLFKGSNGQCAHEFILDMRPFKAAGIVEEDVAKRLQDFGFHGPTMSWPVPGTLMIEPTESEHRAELDRFVDALLRIREEIRDVEEGRIAAADSPLKHAPHTPDVITATTWDRAYTREQAAFPAPWVRERKFWVPVGRVDNVFGDRNLVCSCPPMEAYMDDME